MGLVHERSLGESTLACVVIAPTRALAEGFCHGLYGTSQTAGAPGSVGSLSTDTVCAGVADAAVLMVTIFRCKRAACVLPGSRALLGGGNAAETHRSVFSFCNSPVFTV